jgi:hypothetical protein
VKKQYNDVMVVRIVEFDVQDIETGGAGSVYEQPYVTMVQQQQQRQQQQWCSNGNGAATSTVTTATVTTATATTATAMVQQRRQ